MEQQISPEVLFRSANLGTLLSSIPPVSAGVVDAVYSSSIESIVLTQFAGESTKLELVRGSSCVDTRRPESTCQ